MRINLFNKYMSLQQKEVCKTYDHKLQASYSYPPRNYSVDYTVIHVVIRKSALSERKQVILTSRNMTYGNGVTTHASQTS